MDFKQFLEALTPVLLNGMLVVVTYVFANMGKFFRDMFEEKWKRDLAEQTVKYVEQVFSGMGGDIKKKEAISALTSKLNQKGLSFTDLDVEVLIESAVNEFYAHWELPSKEEPIVVKEAVDEVPLVDESQLESIGSE